MFLQTIRIALLMSRNLQKYKQMLSSIDGGSQTTYVSQRLAKRLNWSAIGKQEMEINALGDTNEWEIGFSRRIKFLFVRKTRR